MVVRISSPNQVRTMTKHRFTLVLGGVSELTPDLANSLYEAAGGDVECEQRAGEIKIDLVRSGTSLQEAITKAIHDIEAARRGVKVVRVESEVAKTIAQINAQLLGA
jgi:hypothetical protein